VEKMKIFGSKEYREAKRRVNDRNTLSKISKLKSDAEDRKKSNDLQKELTELRLDKIGLSKDRRNKLKKGFSNEFNNFFNKPTKRRRGKGLSGLL